MNNIFRSIGLIARATASIGNQTFEEKELQNNQFIYIMRVVETPGITQGELAALLHVEPSTSLRAIRKLETSHFVERRDSPDNKKLKLLFPTEKALNYYPKLKQYESSVSATAMKNLSAGEKLLLTELLEKIAQNMN